MMVLLSLLLACGGADDEPTSPTGGADSAPPTDPLTWAMGLEEADGGVMLGAFTAGDEMIVVGGQLNDGTGTIWHLRDDGWCVEEEAVDAPLWWTHGRSDTDFYMVGERGRIVHEVDGVRTREDVPTDMKLFGVYDDGTDVWAVGGDIFTNTGEIWRKQGGTWALETTTPGLAFKVWENWFIGDGFVWRFDGSTFEDLTPEGEPRLTTIRGRGPDDVYVVGGLQVAVIYHWDGTAWQDIDLDPVCTSGAFNGVYTAPGEDVFVSGMFGVATSWDGEGWSCSERPLTAQHFHAVWHHQSAWWALGGNLTSTATQFATAARYGAGDPPPFNGACDQ